jgi:hypothetical protein
MTPARQRRRVAVGAGVLHGNPAKIHVPLSALFGLSADTIKALTAGPLRLANLTSPDQSRTDEDLLIRVL